MPRLLRRSLAAVAHTVRLPAHLLAVPSASSTQSYVVSRPFGGSPSSSRLRCTPFTGCIGTAP
eukprot:13261250-Alexandrium_andersonii.AAC.1